METFGQWCKDGDLYFFHSNKYEMFRFSHWAKTEPWRHGRLNPESYRYSVKFYLTLIY